MSVDTVIEDWMLAICAGSFMLGVWMVSDLLHIPSPWDILFLGLIFLACGVGWKKRQSGWQYVLWLSSLFLGLGFLLADRQAQNWLNHRVTSAWAGKNITITGVVIELPVEEKQYTRFLFRTERINGQADNKRLQLSWQNPHPDLTVGERWQLMVRLKPPHALTNFGAFNHLRFLWAHAIHGSGYVVTAMSHQTAKGFWLARWRQQLQQEIRQSVQNPTFAAIISALTIGVENGLTNNDWRILQRTGTVHLVVIAGLHIGLMVLIAYFLGDKCWRCFPRGMLRWPAQRAGAVVALIFAIGYGALAGFGVPTQRAVIMLMMLTISQLCDREISAWRRLWMALLAVVIIQPGVLFSAGFWLSFAAVGWILYSKNDQWLRMQWALFLGLTPLTIYFFQQFSLVSILANLPAIVWIGWVIVPLCLLAALISTVSSVAGIALFKTAAYLLAPLWSFLQWLADWKWAGWPQALASPWLLVPACAGAAWCLAPQKIAHRWLGLLGFLPIWCIHPVRPAPGAYWVTMLDVGQGLSLTVQTAHHLLVYDAGMHIPDGFDAGRDVVSPYLLSLGVRQIDLLMVSHGDNDHSGGVSALLTQWPVQRLLTSVPAMFPGHDAEFCREGQQWEWDGVPFRVLWPAAGAYEGNNSSCVLQVGAPGQRLLLTGDIEASAEEALSAHYGADLSALALTVAHHGSRTSSTEGFLRHVQPQYALLSLGYLNRFHFPAAEVTARYQSLGIPQWQTASSGAISLQITPNRPVVVTVANSHHHFWEK
jgi:competence protein ComEC